MITASSSTKPGQWAGKTVAVVGLGYIGLPTAAVLAGTGLSVIGVDVNESTVAAVNAGNVPFAEPDLGFRVSGAVNMGLLSAQTQMPEADSYILAVPTPFMADKSADLKFVRQASSAIAPKLRGGELVVLESTSPPGTTRHMAEFIAHRRPDLVDSNTGELNVLVAHCPERVLPGRIMVELVTNDRIVGGLTPEATEAASSLYKLFCQGEIHHTDAATAEMAKLVENAYRDVNIAFANELSVISENVGVDVWELIALANHHPRVNILEPGPGVGGHCIAVDPWFIVSADPQNAQLIRTAREVNDAKPAHVVQQVVVALNGTSEPVVAAFGLTFKANVEDMRQSPAVEVVRGLAEALPKGRILTIDPHTSQLPAELADLPNVELAEPGEYTRNADATVILVDHDAFKELEFDAESRVVVDTRGMLRVR